MADNTSSVTSAATSNNEFERFRHRLAAAEPALRSLITQLKPGLLASSWSAFLCDDVCGRGPSYILQAYAHELAIAHNVKEPKLIFFAGGVAKPTPEQLAQFFPDWPEPGAEEVQRQSLIDQKRNHLLKAFLADELGDTGQRVLIVTDTVDTGQTVFDAAQQLKDLGMVADIATVGATDTAVYYVKEAEISNLELGWYIGRQQADNGEVLSAPKQSNYLYGIRKNGILPQIVQLEDSDNELIAAVRHELQICGRTLVEKLVD